MSLTKASFAMINGAFYNVLDYGAVGDGVTLNTTAIQAAIDAASAAGGGTVFFPAGTYKTGAIFLKTQVSLVGTGRNSILKGIAGENVIDTPGDMDPIVDIIQGVLISELAIDGAGEDGMRLVNCQRLVVDHVYITNSGRYGIYFKWGYICKFDTVEVDQNGNGSVGTVVDSCNANVFLNCLWFDCRNAAVQLYTTYSAMSAQNNFISCDFENNYDLDVYINGGSSNLFKGCWAESFRSPVASFKIDDNTGTFEQSQNRIEDCYFNGQNYTNIIVLANKTYYTQITGNLFGPSTGDNILISTAAVRHTFLGNNLGPAYNPPTTTDNSESTSYFQNSSQTTLLSGPAFIWSTPTRADTFKIDATNAPTSQQTHLLIRYSDGLGYKFERVTVGAADSGGTGFRVLRVPN